MENDVIVRFRGNDDGFALDSLIFAEIEIGRFGQWRLIDDFVLESKNGRD